MLCSIKKRNGLVVDFCRDKIEKAIAKALQSTDSDDSIANALAKKTETILEALFDKKTPSVEDVQDIIEQILINEGYGKTAKSFILYRNRHAQLRNEKHVISNYIDLVDNYIGLNDWKVNENSNMGYSLQGLNNYISSHVSSNYWLHKIYDEEIANEHLSGRMHIHDLGLLGSYCSGWDLFDLLQVGLRGVEGKIESDPPKHLRSALGQIVNFFYTLQGEAAGAQAFSNFDTLIAPFIRYDGLSQREVKQHMQEFIFNVNVPTRVGFQCVSEDTEILTCDGWKKHNEINIGDEILNFNMKKYCIEEQVVKHVHVSHYNGEMYVLISDKTDQLISPKHRVVFYENNEFHKLPIEDCLQKEILKIPAIFDEDKIEFTNVKISTTQYNGIIWCPNTDNETIIARRNGKVFITGNTPFTNITMDLQAPGYYQDMPVIIGGQPQKETYKEFQKEMDMLNDAFCEVMMEGDAKGRIFTFPIPTYNLTKDFDWDNQNLKGLWKMTSKYGTPYFANFINSDMSVDDARSMCPLTGDTKVLVKSDQNGITINTMCQVINNMKTKKTQYKVWDGKSQWKNVKSIKTFDDKIYILKISNGSIVRMGSQHIQPILINGSLIDKKANELHVGMLIPYNKKNIDQFIESDYHSGLIIGAYLGDGSHDRDAIIFSLSSVKKDILEQTKSFFEKLGYQCVTTQNDGEELISLRVNGNPYQYINRFVSGNTAKTKRITQNVLNQSIEFKTGLLVGYRLTDGSRSKKRIFTSNKELTEDIKTICMMIGKKCLVRTSDTREEGRYGDDEVFRIDLPDRDKYGNLYNEDSAYNYYSIESIEVEKYNHSLYCFEVEGDHPYFTLADGMITHNCRLRLDNRELRKRGGGLFASNPMTGSIGVVTINLPRLAYESKEKQVFFDSVYNSLLIARKSLSIKRKLLERYTENGLYPYVKFYLSKIKNSKRNQYWSNHFNTIGVIGMNEACLNLIDETIATENGKQLAIETLEFIRQKLTEFQEQDDMMYNLEATPGEGTSYRLAQMDKRQYPNIKTSGITEPYYTNSTQLPVNQTVDIFDALQHQDNIQCLYTGGTVLHGFIGEQIHDPEVCKELVKKVSQTFKIPYFTITPTFSICPTHGYIAGEHHSCPVYTKKQVLV